MRFNFKKIAAIGTSLLMTGMSMGFAAAASYPAPFVSGGVANVGIIYGTGAGVSPLDGTYASDISANLALSVSGGGAVTTSGEVVSLDTSGDRIWLNTSLNSVKSTFTKSDLPTVLADYTFSGDVTSKVTSTLKLVAGAAAGGENSGKVIFAKQPSSNDDPVVGVSLGTSQTSYPLYNASATMAAIAFNSSDSEGEEIELFGQTFTISSETDGTNIVLLKEAEKVDLALPSTPSATVTVDGSTYTVTLVTASATVATVTITNSAGVSQTKDVTEATSKRINGIDVAVTRASTSSLESVGESASIIVGSQKVTLTNGAIVTVGEDDDPIDGTYAYIVGGPSACTEITIAVFRPDSTDDVILPGESFVDPVFGNFKMDFAGLNSPVTATDRDMIYVDAAGDDTMTVKFTEADGNEKLFEFAHNQSGSWFLGDDSNYSISVVEGQNLSYGTADTKYVVVGNEDYGHLLELYDVYNQSSGTGAITSDRVKFRDVMTTEVYETTFSSTEGSGTIDVDGKRYTVTFVGTGEDANVSVKYPTSESTATELVVFPSIETKDGSKVILYQPQQIQLDGIGLADSDVSKIWLPDGDSYTGFAVAYLGGGDDGNWTINGVPIWTGNSSTVNATTLTVGQLKYNVTGSGTWNRTDIWLIDPEGTSSINQPGLVILEGKDDDSLYNAVVVDLEDAGAAMGTSTNPVGVNDVLFSSTKYHASASLASDSDITEDMDWFGTLTTLDGNTASQKTVTVSIPTSQVYAQLYFAEAEATISGEAGAIGDVIYKDTEVSSASTKNLIVVGGSCINSVAATLVGGAYCGSEWTTNTGVGSGQFLIKSYDGGSLTSGIAVLVAGYEVADTLNAATYLMNEKPSVAVGDKWIGTSSVSATLQVD
ncbi:MAG: hypothetical protein PHH00_00815 [Candidatus Nanoarchaeia archaeon]|nr:hypothetical protein [Candidatus Nanoarchaeia archaeon]